MAYLIQKLFVIVSPKYVIVILRLDWHWNSRFRIQTFILFSLPWERTYLTLIISHDLCQCPLLIITRLASQKSNITFRWVFLKGSLLWNLIGGRVIPTPSWFINPEWFCPEALLWVFHEMVHFDLVFFPSNRDLSFLASCGSEGTQCFNLCVRISSLASWTVLNNDSIFPSLFSKRLEQRNGILAFIQRSHLSNGTSYL